MLQQREEDVKMRGERRRATPHLGNRLHGRNRYKDNPPNFYALGQQYPSFRPYLRNVDDEKKTASLAFDDPYASRELTATLLKHDFGLDWTIPIDRLCPPLPNRLNYIHWIEDLLHASGIDPFDQAFEIRGIDIGTGASCIYALLGTKMNGWSFLASEIDNVSYQSAIGNVVRNELTERIHIHHVTTSRLLQEPLNNAPRDFQDKQIHFSMCNPPFFGDIGEADTNPDTACMGNASEMVCPGGEVAFIGHMIKDSLELLDRVLVYTSMIGRKSSLRKVLADLRESGVHNVASVEFFQGRTKRWGVAWSFVSTVPLQDQPKVLGKRKESHRQQHVEFDVPVWSDDGNLLEYGCRSLGEVINRLKEYAQSIQDQHVTLTALDAEENVFSVAAIVLASKEAIFEATIEIESANDETEGFTVTIDFESGKRDECWRFCDGLKAATIQSGRQWRRKRNKRIQNENVASSPH